MSAISNLHTMINHGTTSDSLFECMRAVPRNEWTEDNVLETIRLFPENRYIVGGFYEVLFEYIPERCKTYNVCRLATNNRPKMLSHVPKVIATQSFYEDAVSQCSILLSEVPNQFRTTKLCMIAVKSIGNSYSTDVLHHVPFESQTEEMILAAIETRGGIVLSSAAFQTQEICMKAVIDRPTIIAFVDEQTPELCELAIQVAATFDIDDGTIDVLRGVVLAIRDHTPAICISVLKHWHLAMEYLRNHSLEVCLEAIKIADSEEVADVMKDIREQTLEICVAAYRKSRTSYQTIRGVTMRRHVVQLVLATDVLIPLRDADLSTSLLTEVCEQIMGEKFPITLTMNPQRLTSTLLWALAAKVKHFASD